MNRKDRLERIVLRDFSMFNISVDSFHYCYAAILDIMNGITVSHDREEDVKKELAKESERAYIKFLVTNLSYIETVLKNQGYMGKIARVSFVKKPYAPILRIHSSPLYFREYVIYPEVDNFSVTMKCKGHPSKMINVKLG